MFCMSILFAYAIKLLESVILLLYTAASCHESSIPYEENDR